MQATLGFTQNDPEANYFDDFSIPAHAATGEDLK
jgi:hypothetical protein